MDRPATTASTLSNTPGAAGSALARSCSRAAAAAFSRVAMRASRYRHAQPICEPGHLDQLPPVALPVNGLWVADTSYYDPEDRGISESIEFGRSMARMATR